MTPDSLAVFVHVVGALVLYIAVLLAGIYMTLTVWGGAGEDRGRGTPVDGPGRRGV
jgi:hypothetical protein